MEKLMRASVAAGNANSVKKFYVCLSGDGLGKHEISRIILVSDKVTGIESGLSSDSPEVVEVCNSILKDAGLNENLIKALGWETVLLDEEDIKGYREVGRLFELNGKKNVYAGMSSDFEYNYIKGTPFTLYEHEIIPTDSTMPVLDAMTMWTPLLWEQAGVCVEGQLEDWTERLNNMQYPDAEILYARVRNIDPLYFGDTARNHIMYDVVNYAKKSLISVLQSGLECFENFIGSGNLTGQFSESALKGSDFNEELFRSKWLLCEVLKLYKSLSDMGLYYTNTTVDYLILNAVYGYGTYVFSKKDIEDFLNEEVFSNMTSDKIKSIDSFLEAVYNTDLDLFSQDANWREVLANNPNIESVFGNTGWVSQNAVFNPPKPAQPK